MRENEMKVHGKSCWMLWGNVLMACFTLTFSNKYCMSWFWDNQQIKSGNSISHNVFLHHFPPHLSENVQIIEEQTIIKLIPSNKEQSLIKFSADFLPIYFKFPTNFPVKQTLTNDYNKGTEKNLIFY